MSLSPSAPDLLVPAADLKRELSGLIARVKAVPRQPGFDEIRIPGEQSARNRERLAREGVEIDGLVYEKLVELAGPQQHAPARGA